VKIFSIFLHVEYFKHPSNSADFVFDFEQKYTVLSLSMYDPDRIRGNNNGFVYGEKM
jgi:hypothetical protein